jgi:hypothetical protein
METLKELSVAPEMHVPRLDVPQINAIVDCLNAIIF